MHPAAESPQPPPIEPGAPVEPVVETPAPPPPATVLVLDLPPLRPGFGWRLLKVAGFVTIGVASAVAVAGLALYAYFSQELPSIPTAQSYQPPAASLLWSQDGVLAAEFYQERRKLVPYERVPKRMVQAFVAAEDQNFFDHFGVDPIAVTRAVWNMARGKRLQGGSTLTQQTAKAVLVSAEIKLLDEDEMLADAERRVPLPAPPTADKLKAESAAVRKERKERLTAKFAGKPAAEWEVLQALKAAEPELQAEAKSRLLRRAEQERLEAVKAAFLRVREERTREAYKSATVRKAQRKIKEAILARRLEKALTKEEILYLYLNNVYLGHHAYGVQAAAENYYRKDVRDLTLGEIGLLAGLPQSPSRNPYARPDDAKARRGYVLGRMLAERMITPEARQVADVEAPVTHAVEDVFREVAPFHAEQVRRDLVQRYGSQRVHEGGLAVHLTMDAEKQRAAQVAMLRGLIQVDKRQGYTGPLARMPDETERLKLHERNARMLRPDEPRAGEWYVGAVEAIDKDDNFAEVQIGFKRLKLPIMGTRWARKPDSNKYYPQALIDHVSDALKVGDVVLVKAVKKLEIDENNPPPPLLKKIPKDPLLVQLEQPPELQGALVSIEPERNYVVAMIGGYDFDASEYNRAFQACRQPGSAFKPVVYSAAIEMLPDYTPVKPIIDSPVVFDDEENQVRWKPENYGEDFKGEVLLRDAVIHSMNVPAVKTLHAVGVKDLLGWAKKLGLTRPIAEDLSIALGSSCVVPWELLQVFAIFNRAGKRVKPTFVRKVEDRFGRTLEDNTFYDDPWAALEERVAGAYAVLLDRPEQVVTPETAFIVNHLLEEVVQFGTGMAAQRLNKPAAGKTGTTNDSFDAWFMGYTADLVTGTWVGYDRYERPLATYETGGRAALPIWLDYMQKALAGRPQPEFAPPPEAQVVSVKIDPKTGKLAPEDDPAGVTEWFKKGTEPTEDAAKPAAPADFMLHDTR